MFALLGLTKMGQFRVATRELNIRIMFQISSTWNALPYISMFQDMAFFTHKVKRRATSLKDY